MFEPTEFGAEHEDQHLRDWNEILKRRRINNKFWINHIRIKRDPPVQQKPDSNFCVSGTPQMETLPKQNTNIGPKCSCSGVSRGKLETQMHNIMGYQFDSIVELPRKNVVSKVTFFHFPLSLFSIRVQKIFFFQIRFKTHVHEVSLKTNENVTKQMWTILSFNFFHSVCAKP